MDEVVEKAEDVEKPEKAQSIDQQLLDIGGINSSATTVTIP